MKYKINSKFDITELEDINNTMFLTLILTQICNFNCWYCDVLEEHKKSRFITIDDAKKIIEFIDYQDYKMPNLVVHFFGGEPTLNKDLSSIIKVFDSHFLNKRNIDYLITTNLHDRTTLNIHPKLIYAASFHSDLVGSNYGSWFLRAKTLWENFQLYHVVMMLHDDNMDFIEEMYLKYSSSLPCIIAPISQIIGTEKYEKFKSSFIDKYSQNPFDDSEHELFFDKDNKGRIHMCRAGFIIDEFGNIFHCWNEFNDQSKHNIFNNPKINMSLWHPCMKYSSSCDMEVPRSSVRYYNSNFKNNILKSRSNVYTLADLKQYKSKGILFRCNG